MPAVRLSLLCLLVGLLAALPAFAAPKMQTFHIEAGDATFTLNEFSRQSSLQLLFDYNIVRGRRTRAVSGEFEAPAALQQMLTDTGLIFDFVNERTLAVTLNGRPGGAGSAVAEASRSPRRTQSSEAQSVTQGDAGSGNPALDPRAIDLQEITILGTHLHGAEPVGEHVVHLGREDINNSPSGTVQDLLRTLPQTWGGGPTEDTHFFSAETPTNSGLGSGINLRALGAKATLVLINGKRMAPSGTDAAFSDIENIPIAAVERMDILSDGASAVYGSDAVGGVVNFVMRDNFTGAETLLRGGSGTQNTLQEYQAAQTLGTRWDSGNAMVSLEFYKRGDLPAYARRYTNSDLTSLGGDNFDLPFTNPGNLITNFGQLYAIPRGQNGTGLSIGNLRPNAPNLGDRYAGAEILPSQKRWSLYAAGKQTVSDAVTVYGNALASRRQAGQSNGGYLATALLVPASNAFFPAGVTSPEGMPNSAFVQYNFLDDLGPFATDVIVNNFNVTAGLDIAVGSAWKVNLYGNYAQEKENQLTTGLPDAVALAQALADPDPATAFNPFGDGSHTNAATLAAIRTSTRYYTNSRLRTANITADGPLATLPGGDLKLALGVDHRNQVYATLQSATSALPALALDGSRNVTAAFGELRIPVFGRSNALTGLSKLEFSLAGRYEKYSDFGNAATPKFGVTWSPLDAVAFRGTWGRSIRAPTLAELSTKLNLLAARPVPYAGAPQGVALALFETGNSPDITVERARSWTAGFDVDAARWIPGLSFSATYFNINFRDRIQAPTFDLNVLNDPAYARFVIHNPSAAQLEAACSQGTFLDVGSCTASGATAIIDVRNHNLASVRTSGIDLNAFYERRWAPGTLKIRLDGTYLADFKQQAFPDAPALQLLNTQNNPMNLKLRSVLTWQQLRWGTSLGINFQNHYQDIASEPSRGVRSFTTFDAQLRYAPPAFGSSLLENTSVELNAVNLFNSSPPFLNNATAGLGYDQENADPTGRLLSIQVRKNW